MIKTFKYHEISNQFVKKFNLGAEEHELFSFLAHNKECWSYIVTEYDRYGTLFDDGPAVILFVRVSFSNKFFDLEILKKDKQIDLLLKNGEIVIEIDKLFETLEAKEIEEIFKELEK